MRSLVSGQQHAQNMSRPSDSDNIRPHSYRRALARPPEAARNHTNAQQQITLPFHTNSSCSRQSGAQAASASAACVVIRRRRPHSLGLRIGLRTGLATGRTPIWAADVECVTVAAIDEYEMGPRTRLRKPGYAASQPARAADN